MAQKIKYAAILTQILRKKSKTQYPFQPGLKLISCCDDNTGQFLLVRIGWDKTHWHHSIVFHAQLIHDKIIIETDMTEGLHPLLLEAGIPAEAFLSDRERDRIETEKIAA